MIKFTFLGTGTSQGVPVIGCQCEVCVSTDTRDKRLRVAGHLEFNGVSILFDVGPDIRQQLLRAGKHVVDAVLLTHEHNDHIIGLDDLRPIYFKAKDDINLYGLARVNLELEKRFEYVFESVDKYPGTLAVQLNEIAPFVSFDVHGREVMPLLVHHGQLKILGYKVGNFAYLTDVKLLPAQTLEVLKGVNHLVISALHHTEHHSHLTLEQCLAYIEQIEAKQAYIIHMSHHMGLHAEVSKDLPDHVQLAFDGLQIQIG